MLGDERRRIELSYALKCSLPGAPVNRYGEELGMGENLDLPERHAIRTPMKWSGLPSGGFSTAARKKRNRQMIADGPYGYPTRNVDAQRDDPGALLAWFERMFRALRECPEFGADPWELLDTGCDHVIALRFGSQAHYMVAISNLADVGCVTDLAASFDSTPTCVVEMFANRHDADASHRLEPLELDGWGYRWIRIDPRWGRLALAPAHVAPPHRGGQAIGRGRPSRRRRRSSRWRPWCRSS